MAFSIKNKNILSETVSRRVPLVGDVDPWLIVETNLTDVGPEMTALIKDVRDFLKQNPRFNGVEIQSPTVVG